MQDRAMSLEALLCLTSLGMMQTSSGFHTLNTMAMVPLSMVLQTVYISMHAHDFVSLLRSFQLLLVSEGGPAGVEPLVGLLELGTAWGRGLDGAVLQERGLELTALGWEDNGGTL